MLKAFVNDGDLEEHASAVRKAIVDVRTVCEELLSKNVDAIKTTLNEVKLQNSDMMQQNIDMQQQIGTLHSRIDGTF